MSGTLLKGDRMNQKNWNQMIGFAVMAILAYYILQMLVPYLFWGVIGMVIWRIVLERNKFK